MLFPHAGNGPYRLLRAFNARPIAAFEGACLASRPAQRARLGFLLRAVAGTAFGRAHGLSPAAANPGAGLPDSADLDAFRAAVPIRTHAELTEWFDRVAGGERDVLTRAPVRSLLETSGTTGRPKWLPVTDAWARSVADAQALWVLGLLRDDEALARGKALSIVSSAEHARSAGGLAVGSNTGRMFLAQPWWVRWRAPVPYAAYEVEDPDVRAYCVLRHALGQPVRSWTTANPSTILLYCRRMREWWGDLQADAAEGVVARGPAASLSPADRGRLGRGLRRLRLPDDPTPAAVWDIRRVNCWTGGAAPFFLGRLGAALGRDVPVREVGVTASEGFFAIPVDDGPPVAWLGGHLLEFVDDGGTPRWAWELEQGREYRLVVSTEAGLYRYDLGDIVRVEGWYGEAPRLSFRRKAGNMLNATGEKVTENQVVDAAFAAFPGAAGISVSMGWREVPVFRVAVEGVAVEGVAVEGVAGSPAFDEALRRLNVEYDAKRASGRLGPPEISWVPDGCFAAWRRARVLAGAPDAQVKDPIVLDAERWDALVRA